LTEEEIIIYAAIFLALAIGWLVGKLMDPVYRAKTLRSLTKKEWGVLAIASPDNKTVRSITVNFSKDVINVQGKVWIIEQEKIYRMDKPERGFRLDRVDLPKRWFDGIPYVFVNDASFLPIDIMGNVGNTKPEEIASVFLAWNNNQIAKGMLAMKNQQLFVIIACIMSLLAAIFGFMAFQKGGDMQSQLTSIDARTKEMATTGVKYSAVAQGVNPATLPAYANTTR